jgi:hypothetical protein
MDWKIQCFAIFFELNTKIMLLQGLAVILFGSVAILWSLIFLPVSFFGVRLYKISGSNMLKFLSKVKHASIWNGEKPEGWIIGYPYFGYIQIVCGEKGKSTDLLVLTTTAFHKSMTSNVEIDGKCNTKILNREGCYWSMRYESSVHNTKRSATPKQQSIIDDMINDFNKRQNSVCVLFGEKGTGKSMIPLLLCKELAKKSKCVTYTKTFNPTEPNDTLSSLYNTVSPSVDSPLVICLEEFDRIIFSIHNNNVTKNKYIPTQVTDKTGWNIMLDDIDRDIYPHMFFIMTTNKTIDWFNDMDSSYLRNGRVTLSCEVTK